METNKATIKRGENNASLILHVNSQEFEIILTDDNPNNVKSVFNNLLKELKKGLFGFNLDDETMDLYHDICVEYLKQLNTELKSVHTELIDYDLLES
ncbi:MAG TPA: hypothetical protein VKG26_16645 [Bacteroidia bacterium]|nr:hypothetical protein [Bacteroidia bacterium]